MWPPALAIRLASNVHAVIYQRTGGAIGGQLGKLPFLLLTTVGRKSGRRRTIPLLYLRDGDNLVIVASNGGHDRHPGWFWNLTADGHTEVQIYRTTLQMTAV